MNRPTARPVKMLPARAVLAATPARAAPAPAQAPPATAEGSIDRRWGAATVMPGLASSDRFALFRDGHDGLLIHGGIDSHLGGPWTGQTVYGIGEWIKRPMKISEADSMAEAKNLTPTACDAREIVRVAHAAGLGCGFYDSHNQDWTAPGGNHGPRSKASLSALRLSPVE